jgi:hypothetical protein
MPGPCTVLDTSMIDIVFLGGRRVDGYLNSNIDRVPYRTEHNQRLERHFLLRKQTRLYVRRLVRS